MESFYLLLGSVSKAEHRRLQIVEQPGFAKLSHQYKDSVFLK
jgi:hypothetical protein